MGFSMGQGKRRAVLGGVVGEGFAGYPLGQVVADCLCLPQIIYECVTVRAPPPDGNEVLSALGIIDSDISPGHVPLPCPGIS